MGFWSPGNVTATAFDYRLAPGNPMDDQWQPSLQDHDPDPPITLLDSEIAVMEARQMMAMP